MPFAATEIPDVKTSDYPADKGPEPFRIPEIPAAAIQNATDPKTQASSVKSAADYPADKPDVKPPKEEPFSIPEIPDNAKAQVPPSALVQPGSGSPTPLSVQMGGDPVAQPPTPPAPPAELPKESSAPQVPPSEIVNPGSGDPTPLSTQMGTPAAQADTTPVEGAQADPGALTSDPTLGKPVGTGDHPFLPQNVDVGNLPEDTPETLEDKADKIARNPVGLAPEVADKIQLDEANKYNPKIPPPGTQLAPEPFSIPEIPSNAQGPAPPFSIPEIPDNVTNPLSPQSIAAKFDYDANKINDAQKNLQIGDASNDYGFKQAYNAAIYASQYRNNRYMNEDDVHKIMDIAKDGWNNGAQMISDIGNTVKGIWELPGAGVRAAGAFKEAMFPTGSAIPNDSGGNAPVLSAIGAAGTPLAEGSDIVNPIRSNDMSTNAPTLSKENLANYQQMEQRVGVAGVEKAWHDVINPATKAASWLINQTGDVYRALGIPGSKQFGALPHDLQTTLSVAGLPVESGQDMNTMDPQAVLAQMRASRQIANQALAYSSGYVGPLGESVLKTLHGGAVKTPEQLDASGQGVNKSQIEDIANVGSTLANIAEMELIGKFTAATGWHNLTGPATDAILGTTSDAFQGVADATAPKAVKAAKVSAAKDAEIQAGLEAGGRDAEKAQIAQQTGQTGTVSDPIKQLGKTLVNNRIDDVLSGAAGAAAFHVGFPFSMLAIPGVQAARWVANGALGLLSKGAEFGNRAINWAAENTSDALGVQADNHFLGKSLFTAEDTRGPIKQIFGSAVRNAIQGSLDQVPTAAIMSGGDPRQFANFVGLGGAMHAAGGIVPKLADVVRNQIADQSFITDNNWNANRLPAAPPKAYGTDPVMDAHTADAMGRTDPNLGPVRTNAERHTFNELQNQFEGIAQLHVLDKAPFAAEVQRLSNLGYINDPEINARGVAIDPTPGATKARILVRSDHFDDAIHHELSHAIVNRMAPQDKADLFSVYRINNDPNDFSQTWYGKKYNSLPENDADASTQGLAPGITKSDIQNEMVTEATSGLIKGHSLRELTNDPTQLAVGQKALWNVLDSLGFDPFTTRSNSVMGLKQSIMSANMLEPLVRKTLRDNPGTSIPPVDLSGPPLSSFRPRPQPSAEVAPTEPVAPPRSIPTADGGVLRENPDHPFTSTAGEWQPVPKNVDITQVRTPANPEDISAGNRSPIRVENERIAANAQGNQNAYSVRPETPQKPVYDPRSGGWKTTELQRAYLPPENVSLKEEGGQWHYRTDDKPAPDGPNGSTPPQERPIHPVDKDVAKALRGLQYSAEDAKYFASRVTGDTIEDRVSDALKLARERKEAAEAGASKPKDKPINQDAVNKIAREGLLAKGWNPDDIAEHMPTDKGTGLEAMKGADANRKAKETGSETADQLSDRQKRIVSDMEEKSKAQPSEPAVQKSEKKESKTPGPPQPPQAPKYEKVEPKGQKIITPKESDITLESGKVVRADTDPEKPESGIYKVSKRRYQVQDGQGNVYRKLNWSEANEIHEKLQGLPPEQTPPKVKEKPKPPVPQKMELPSAPRRGNAPVVPVAQQQQEAPEVKQEPKTVEKLPSAPVAKPKAPTPEPRVEKAIPVEEEQVPPPQKPIVIETNAQNAEFIKHLMNQGLSHGEAQHAANGIESGETKGAETFTTKDLNTTGKPPSDPGGHSVHRDLPVTSTPAPIRYLNPSGMWDGPSSRKFGSLSHGIISGGNHIAQFDTPEQGAAAQFDLLNSRSYVGKSVIDIVRKWTESHDENEIQAYSNAISKAGGIKPTDIVTTEFLKGKGGIELAKEQAKQESGKPFPITDAQWKKAQEMAYNGVTGPSGSSLTESSKGGGGYSIGPSGPSTPSEPSTEKPPTSQTPSPATPSAPKEEEPQPTPVAKEESSTVPEPSQRSAPIDDASIQRAEDSARAAIQQKSMSDADYSRALNQHMLQTLGEQHAASLDPGDTRVQLLPNGNVAGTHFVEDDAFHNFLLQNQSPQTLDVLKTVQDAIANKRDIAFNYNSAPQSELGMPTGAHRLAEQEASAPRDRAQGIADIQTAQKSLIPTWVGVSKGLPGKAEPPFSVMLGGTSSDKLAGNIHQITQGLGNLSPYGVAPMGSKPELDLRGYLANHSNGWKGDGSSKLIVPPEEKPNVPEESAEYIPYRMSPGESAFWNLATTGSSAKLSAKGAKTGPGARSTAALEMAELNAGYSEKANKGAYTNPWAKRLDLQYGPQPVLEKGPDGVLQPKVGKNGKIVTQDWTKAKLSSAFESLRADLVDPHIHDADKIHPEHEVVTKSIQEQGAPRAFIVKSGFLPGDTVEAKGERERISAAAVRTGRGALYTAPNHHDAVVAAMDAGEPQDPRGWEHGYTTIPTEGHPDGRFLPREGTKEYSEPVKEENVPHKTKAAFMPGETTGFVSPEYGSGKDFKEVGKDFTGDNHRQAKTYFNKVDRTIAKMSGKGASSEAHDVFGDFPTGAEASVMTEHQHVPYDLAKAGEAAKAMHQRQLSSLVWEEHPQGAQMLHTIDTDLSPEEARAQLTKHGIENRTILADTPSNEPTRIKLYNPGPGDGPEPSPYDITDNVAKFIDDPDSRVGGRHTYANGRGEFIGDDNWESRDAAADGYRRVSQQVQSARPDLDWKDYNDHWAEAERHHQQIKAETEGSGAPELRHEDVNYGQFMPGDDRERIKSAAILHNGNRYEGFSHAMAYANAEDQLGEMPKRGSAKKGFVTTPTEEYPEGRFVDRKEAWQIAKDNNQLKEGARELQPLSKVQKTPMGGKIEGLASENVNVPQKAQFMPGDIIEKNGERERVKAAAVHMYEGSGKTYEGHTHYDADLAATEAGEPYKGREHGFTTTPTSDNPEGRFLNRSDAWHVARGAQQVKGATPSQLDSLDLLRPARGQFMPGDKVENAHGDREEIKSPAVRYPSGSIYEGVNHPDAFDEGQKQGEMWPSKEPEKGYMTKPTSENPDGRFVGDKEGWKIGKRSNQLHPAVDPDKGFLNSEDLADYPHPEDREPAKAQFMPPDNALPVEYAKNKDGSPKVDKKGKPVPVKINFDLSKAPRIANKQPEETMPDNAPNTMKHFDYLTDNQQKQLSYQDKASATGTLAKRATEQLREWLKDPNLKRAEEWYESMRKKLSESFGNDHEMFSHLLGVTSPRENPHENFLYALEAYERLQKGDFARHIDLYQKAYDMQKAGTLVPHVEKLIGRELKGDKKGNKSDAEAMAEYIHHHDILPERENGKLYGTHGNGILRAISKRWLDEPGAPKTKNYAGNLLGTTNEATIDSWAARFIRQLGYGGEKQWRIQPKSETGVGDYDFAFSQLVFKKAAKALEMPPDAVQAVAWYALKGDWEQKGWMKGMGAEQSSLDTPFDMAHPEGNTGPRLSATRVREMFAEKREAAEQAEKDAKAATKAEAKQVKDAAKAAAKEAQDAVKAAKKSKIGPPIPSMSQ